MNNGPGEAVRILEEKAMNNYQWPLEQRLLKRTTQIESSEVSNLKEEVALLKDQLVAQSLSKREVPPLMSSGPHIEEHEDVCYVNQIGNRAFINYGNQGRYNNFQGGGNFYHPNFIYANPNNVLRPLPGFFCGKWSHEGAISH